MNKMRMGDPVLFCGQGKGSRAKKLCHGRIVGYPSMGTNKYTVNWYDRDQELVSSELHTIDEIEPDIKLHRKKILEDLLG